MGVRLYLPSLGRFTQVDPVEGGGDNNYGYPTDAVNDFDLDGKTWGKTALKWATRAATVASFVPGPIGMVAGAVAASGYAAQGNWKAAGIAALGSATFGIGRYTTVVGGAMLKTKSFGAFSSKFGNTSALPNKSRLLASAYSGSLNSRYRKMNIGWSVGKKGKDMVFRVSIKTSFTKKALHYTMFKGLRRY